LPAADEGFKALQYPPEAENLALNNENEYEDDDEYEVMHRF
jgi:hypothetical protein